MPSWVGIVISATMSIIVFVYTISRNRQHDDTDLRKEIGDLQSRMVALETKISVFWRGVSFSAAQVLHSPHNPELDELIEKFQHDQIDDQELRKFKGMLGEIAKDDSNKLHQKAARDVLTLIRVRYEINPELEGSMV